VSSAPRRTMAPAVVVGSKRFERCFVDFHFPSKKVFGKGKRQKSSRKSKVCLFPPPPKTKMPERGDGPSGGDESRGPSRDDARSSSRRLQITRPPEEVRRARECRHEIINLIDTFLAFWHVSCASHLPDSCCFLLLLTYVHAVPVVCLKGEVRVYM
jgi:hypothetical protein